MEEDILDTIPVEEETGSCFGFLKAQLLIFFLFICGIFLINTMTDELFVACFGLPLLVFFFGSQIYLLATRKKKEKTAFGISTRILSILGVSFIVFLMIYILILAFFIEAAVFLLLLTAFPIIVVNLILLKKTRSIGDLFGVIAGLWTFFGLALFWFDVPFSKALFLFFILNRTMGFSLSSAQNISYLFLIFGFIITGKVIEVYVPSKALENLSDNIASKLDKLNDLSDHLPKRTLPQALKPFFFLFSTDKNLRRLTLCLWVVALILVLSLYSAFFSQEVYPAQTRSTIYGHVELECKETIIERKPHHVRIEYRYESAYLVIDSIRTLPLSNDFYEKALKDIKPLVKQHVREACGSDAEVTLIKTSDNEEFNGHEAAMARYRVVWTETIPNPILFLPDESETKEGKMLWYAFYCTRSMKTVALGLFYPDDLEEIYQDILEDINCHDPPWKVATPNTP
jgi:hypothetical protein